MPINEKQITNEMIAKAMQCESPEELRAYAKSEGFDITEEEAKAYFSELEDKMWLVVTFSVMYEAHNRQRQTSLQK